MQQIKRIASLKIIQYFLVGGTAALVEWVGFAIFHNLLSINYLLAAILSFIFSTAVNYVLSSNFVFTNGRYSTRKEIFLVYTVSVIGLGLNLALMFLLVEILIFAALPSKIISTGLVFFWNFAARKVWIFNG